MVVQEVSGHDGKEVAVGKVKKSPSLATDAGSCAASPGELASVECKEIKNRNAVEKKEPPNKVS